MFIRQDSVTDCLTLFGLTCLYRSLKLKRRFYLLYFAFGFELIRKHLSSKEEIDEKSF